LEASTTQRTFFTFAEVIIIHQVLIFIVRLNCFHGRRLASPWLVPHITETVSTCRRTPQRVIIPCHRPVDHSWALFTLLLNRYEY
jgi:hypothetical protein